MKITIGNEGRYNFHNAPDINIVVLNPITRDGKLVATELTPAQIQRAKAHFCGISNCDCGSHPVGWKETDYKRVIIHF